MKLELDKRFIKKLKVRIEKRTFEVGILQDGPHYLSKRDADGVEFAGPTEITSYAGGPISKRSRTPSGLTISEVSEENRKRLGKNYLSEPFQDKDSDIIKFTDAFLKFVFGRGKVKRVENLLQAIVRNPILRGEYGSNSRLTRRIKGFNRSMMDTGQLFKAIRARVVGRV